jgi:mannosidase alpha-like ER degradation enhancer 2
VAGCVAAWLRSQAYLRHAFPHDELLPLSCRGKDTFGAYALTAVDALDTLAVMGNCTEFRRIARWAMAHLDFDVNKTVSVFETNIRVLGGLLSAHQLAVGAGGPHGCGFAAEEGEGEGEEGEEGEAAAEPPYAGGLLRLAYDLGERLLPAFETPTGIPYGSVNLRHGVDEGESNVTASATAGTLMLEFWTLSELTDDPRFATAARRAVRALWRRRSPGLNLVGAHINIVSGAWVQKESGIGGLVDSFYEYLLKAYVLTGEEEFLRMFNQAYTAAMSALKAGPWYLEVNMDNGQVVWPTFQSLQCFWPGMQALVGDLEAGAETIEAFYRIWNLHGATPEGFNLQRKGVPAGQAGYPLRPELAESAMYMHQASGGCGGGGGGDPAYLELGKQIVASLQTITRVPCGFASIENVVTRQLTDIMDSFFLAETCKYLYLLFDPDNFVRRGRYVFNTEGHPLALPQHRSRRGRPRMTAARAQQWHAALSFSDLDDGGGGGGGGGAAAEEPGPGQPGQPGQGQRYVSLRGLCATPSSVYARVASRGLNRSHLSEHDLLGSFFSEAQQQQTAAQSQTQVRRRR